MVMLHWAARTDVHRSSVHQMFAHHGKLVLILASGDSVYGDCWRHKVAAAAAAVSCNYEYGSHAVR